MCTFNQCTLTNSFLNLSDWLTVFVFEAWTLFKLSCFMSVFKALFSLSLSLYYYNVFLFIGLTPFGTIIDLGLKLSVNNQLYFSKGVI